MLYKFDKENLIYVPLKTKRISILGTLLLMIISVGIYGFISPNNPIVKTIYKFKTTESKTTDVKLNADSITIALRKHGCVLPNVAVAQAKLESNLGKSQVGKNAKNLFGITYHKCKYVTGKYGVYAKYDTYEDNIKCYIHIQDHYLTNIDGRYASDSEYTNKLKQIK
jgi:uncharacterized FlgJ-related protein